MSSVFNVPQLRDMTNETDPVETTNLHLCTNAIGESLKRRHPDHQNPPPVPPPTRSSTPPAEHGTPVQQGQFTFVPPLTPADFSPVETSHSPESARENEIKYHFVPPLTPFDFQLDTSELWKALEDDSVDSLDFNFEFDSPLDAPYAMFQPYAPRRSDPSLGGLWDQSASDLDLVHGEEKKSKSEGER